MLIIKVTNVPLDIHYLCRQGVQVSHDRYRSMWLVVDLSCEWCPPLAVADQFSFSTSPRCC
ncbi:hypothetical protein F2Q70_00011558 [Brassica cretica]|uniref:Uncharacterized protein n=1 Tax=Brassica cretica TaxID=69181 RepID=A0A8S9MFY6_BRACR|nr:hypothetical protein F2Q70_00011558 [Brassica cretica]